MTGLFGGTWPCQRVFIQALNATEEPPSGGVAAEPTMSPLLLPHVTEVPVSAAA